MKDSSYRNYYR